MKKVMGIIVALAFVLAASMAEAAKSDLDKFYKPVKSNDLVTILPPKPNEIGLDSTSSFFSGTESGCPDTISIGSIDSDSPIYGNVEINVVVTNDIVVSCGGL